MRQVFLLVGFAGLLLACSLFQSESVVDPNSDNEGFFLSAPAGGAAPESGISPVPHPGATSLEERILRNPTVVRATLDRVTTEVIEAGGHWEGKYVNIVKFHLTVSEYLNGSGGTSVIAVWGSVDTYDSRGEADVVRESITEGRDTRWDDVEAIFFLNPEPWVTFSAIKAADTYYTASGDFAVEDFLSIGSRSNQLWLPLAPSSTGTGDDKRFLLDAPENAAEQQLTSSYAARNATSTPAFAYSAVAPEPPTITLRDLKAKIAEINAEIEAGDGSEAYMKCVQNKYYLDRRESHAQSEGREDTSRAEDTAHTTAAGAPAGTVIYEDEVLGWYPDDKILTTWLEGEDAALFEMTDGTDITAEDRNGDGESEAGVDRIRYQQMLQSTRPLPNGRYAFNVSDLSDIGVPCNDVHTYEWTVTATAPPGSLHESFFDPVTVGTAVAADGTNGVLKPAAFTDLNGASATTQRIEWQAGTVTIGVTPDDALAGHVVDFIELDGSVSLSLDVADATVDAANDTLSWTVASQPWNDGDLLMVRIREAR